MPLRLSMTVLRSMLLHLVVLGLLLVPAALRADAGTDFRGQILAVDAGAGKLTVKKEDGGSRFTFKVNAETKFSGPVAGLKDLKKGDRVTVRYVVSGSDYIARQVTTEAK